ncbi:hypothetical protein QMK19_35075 [Streptomyces sp. H10-C2]|uniref:hypothetical protein n=1 Tax=unclassified Streptomyces TaxID=2593676 RepID=UPI0024BBC8B8|nr:MULTISPECIES: hypothetical protein [unclassified Streptomyces]MDJ0345817.1 hypothetical protein [Streptomyces sp. PH10-H1]MDJ0374707.1 hypothetical protein [Streptomyces sp. H10-C2]
MGTLSRRNVLAGLVAAAGPGLAAPAQAADSAHASDRAQAMDRAAAVPAAQRAAAAIPSPAGLPLTGGPEFPIGVFWPPHPFASTPERFKEIADAGFGFLITGNYAEDRNIVTYQLGLAETAGLKVLVSDDHQVADMARQFTISEDRATRLSITRAEAVDLYTHAKNAYSGYSSFAGFNLYDEPSKSWFPSLARTFDVAREVTPGLLPYVNLNGSDLSYFQAFVDTVKPSLLSFDRYPLYSTGEEDAKYFLLWSTVRKAALSAGIPSWIFIQSVSYDGHRTPTAAEVLWQINVSLAYGAKGIQYFTYWTPDPARLQNYGPALITVDGQRTPLYDAARTINTTWLSPVGRQLKPLVSESVVHANETPLPKGAVGFAPNTYLRDVTGQAVILGTFKGTEGGDRLLLVTNRSLGASASATVTVRAAAVSSIELFDPASNAYVPTGSTTKLQVNLAPGAATLARLRAK